MGVVKLICGRFIFTGYISMLYFLKESKFHQFQNDDLVVVWGTHRMLGAIAGDIIGSVYEWYNVKTTDFPLFTAYSRFTDDTVLTIATACAILNGTGYEKAFKTFGLKYPDAGYGGYFQRWLLSSESRPYNSWGNGSAMRVSPIGFAYDSVEAVLREARKSAEPTHNHPEGIKGAQATALAVFRARNGSTKNDILEEISDNFGYVFDKTLDEIRPAYSFDVSCAGTVPQALTAFLESNSYEDAIRKAVSLGGDSDTIACITGGIAHAFYNEIPEEIETEVCKRLPEELHALVQEFRDRFRC